MNRVAVVALRRAVTAPTCRNVSTSATRMQEQVDLTKIKQAQRKFQIDNGVPIHLKGGLLDQFLFGTTAVLCVYGLGYSATLLYSLA